jgi:hypothetical protein
MRSLRTFPLLGLAAVVIVSLTAVTAVRTSAQAPSRPANAQAVVTRYFEILNAGMKSGDFSGFASVFAPDATFTKSTPTGVTTVYHGLAAITKSYHTLQTSLPGYQWTTDSLRMLSPTVMLAYEHAGSPPLTAAGRCTHVFVVRDGKIATYDWIVFFPGKK